MNVIVSKKKSHIKSDIGWWPFIFAVIMCDKMLGFRIPQIELISYAALIFAVFSCLKHGFDFDRLSALFILYIPVALALAWPDPVFRSWPRYTLFVLLYLATSPLVKNDYAKQFRTRVFKISLILCILVSAISFVCYFLGINMMRSTYDGSKLDYLVITAGTFGGLTPHSMLLGPISGIATLACSYLAMNRDKRFWALTVMCAGSMLFAASRSSLLASLCGEMVLFYFSSESLGKNIKRILAVGAVLLATYPLWNVAMTGIMAKNQGSIYEGVNTESRTPKWNLRIEEWESSPICGIGFCAVSDKDAYTLDGKIEPGSSWLAVLSMTGIIGFVLFCCLYFRACKHVLQPHTSEGALIGAVLILLGVHMIAEGHIFSAGSYLCFLVWLAIGRATDYRPSEQLRFTK